MVVQLSMALEALLRKAGLNGNVDLLREGVQVLSQALMELEVTQHVGARRHERTPQREGQRNGSGSGNQIVMCDQQRLLLAAGSPIRFTLLEYRIIKPLVSPFGVPVPLKTLARAAFDSPATPTMRRAMDRHVDRMRTKLRPIGLAMLYVTNCGYLLLEDDG